MKELIWLNLFIRDFLLSIVLIWINYHVNYQSWWVAFLSGALFVLVSWHFSDYIKTKRRLA